MTTTGTELDERHDPPIIYRIRVRGHLGSRWNGWFDQMAITPEDNGDTSLTGPIVDQAALHAVLTRVRDLGLPLLSITCIDPDRATAHRKDTP